MGIGSVSIPGPVHTRDQSGSPGRAKAHLADAHDVRSALRMPHLRALGRENPIAERGIPVHPPGAVSRSVFHRLAPGSD
jgi:hypothetical protein